ncbi:GlcNAc transferase [Thauera sp. 28]|uniref:glycosyltransferase n=1 Tax=Thauera sp. 28 TaxID=303682 RepID=UPI0002CE82AF|nr:glycosyltransferase [Thauera sp. 28]ENO91836.1 GlcNAc transferase [Thauera sp. 28]
MKVLVISNMYPTHENPGFGVFVKNFVDALGVQGAQIDLAVIRGRGKGKLNKLLKYLTFGAAVLVKGFTRRYDCIYVHYVAHSMLPVGALMGLKRTVLVCNAHGEDLLPARKSEKLIFRLVRPTIEKARLIVVPSSYFQSIAKDLFPKNEIFVSPSAGVDLEVFKPNEPIRERFHSSPLRVGFVSRIDSGKGWDVLLDAVAILRKQSPSLELEVALVGEGSEIATLTKRIRDLGLEGVAAHVGAMPQRRLPDFYSSLDVFVFPTLLPESLGLVGIEALASGTPAICSDIGGIQSYMRDGINGYLFPPGDSSALAQRIMAFSQLSIEEMCAMRSAALATAQQYERKKVGAELHAKLVEVIGH